MSASPEKATSASTETFTTALVLNVVIAAIEIGAFTLIRRRFRSIYEPRTYIPRDEKKRVGPLSPSLLGWPMALWHSDPKLVLQNNGADAYCYLLFLRMVIKILLPIWPLSWIILMPVNSVNTSVEGNQGLNKFTFGNIAPDKQIRYVAHLILLWVFTFWILYNLREAMKEWIVIRQRYLISEDHSKLPQARTVLFTGVPKKYLDEERLEQLFSHIPGGTKHIWLNRDLKDMPDDFNNRLKASKKLESATTALIKTAHKLRTKAEKAAEKNGQPLEDKWTATPSGNETEGSIAERLVPEKKRPTHKLPSPKWMPFALPFLGTKVDTINWCKDQIVEHDKNLESKREQLRRDIKTPGTGDDETYPPLNSAFVLFNQQIGAHLACQSLIHNEPYAMSGRYIETAPADVIWANLGMNPYEKSVRRYVSIAITAGIILFWAIPVAFVGIVSNVPALCIQYSWLAWLCSIPVPVPGIISGVLPPALLAVLFMLLPIILRLLARFEGIPKRTGVELSLMTRYFIFLVIHGFLIVTLASGLIKALPELANNPSSIATVLATKLPGASVFFLTYITLQGIAGSAGMFIQYVPLALYYVKLFLLGSTPRAVYNIKYTMRSIQWGTVFPNTTLLIVITIAYMNIQPVINGLACFSFFLLYFAYKYLFTWVYEQDPASDTGGLFFPKAITHVFIGLYIQGICLTALFFLARDQNGDFKTLPEAILAIILLVIVLAFHIILEDSYGPLKKALPVSLAHRSYGMPAEKGHGSSAIGEDEDGINSDKQPLNPSSAGRRSADYAVNGSGAPTTNDGGAALSNAQNAGVPLHESTPQDDIELRKRATHSTVTEEELVEHDGHKKHGFGGLGRFAKGSPRHDDVEGSNPNSNGTTTPSAREEAELEAAFTHPAAKTEQQTIWVPQDQLGLADEAVRDYRARGIKASARGTTLTDKGKVEISEGPPEEDIEEV